MRTAWTLRGLGLVGMVGFLSSAFTPLPNLLASTMAVKPHIGPAGAIIVLGAGIEAGRLTDESLRRLMQGLVLFREGYAPLLVLSGGSDGRGPSEADVRAGFARNMGIPQDAILEVPDPLTTRQEADRMRPLLTARNIGRVMLVTESQHMLRARALFNRAGFEVLPAASDEDFKTADTPEGRLNLARDWLGEAVARMYYRMAGYL